VAVIRLRSGERVADGADDLGGPVELQPGVYQGRWNRRTDFLPVAAHVESTTRFFR
jgi:hypothetical protein